MTNPRNAAAMTEKDRHRVLQRFASLKGRGVELRFTALLPTVSAASPEGLLAETEALILEITGIQPPT